MAIIKQPRTWIEISASDFNHNLACYTQYLGADIAVAVVVKSNGYGHGLLEIGRLCQENSQVAWLCTAMLSEALLLRAHGITKPILVLSFIDDEPRLAIEQGIDLVVYDMQTLMMLNACGQSLGMQASIHIKIDTGMSRFGFRPHEALAAVRTAAALPYITLRGLCTHFADSGNSDQTFTQMQSQCLANLMAEIEAEGIAIPLVHTSNSAGVLIENLACRETMVRIGAGVYGLLPAHQWPQPTIPLKPIMTWKTTITSIRNVSAGSSIGYGRFFTAARTMRMGFIPIGYYDGYNAGAIAPLYNGIVRVRDQSAPVIGRLCMNVVMIDLTDIPTAAAGDEVIVMGDYPNLRPYDQAVRTGSNNGRVVSSCVSPQIPRVIIPG